MIFFPIKVIDFLIWLEQLMTSVKTIRNVLEGKKKEDFSK